MFDIEHISENNFYKIILKDDKGTTASIIPSCGAVLHAFVVNQNGNNTNVIESYDSKDDFKKNAASKGFLGCKLSPFVCRINKGQYNFNGRDLKIEKYYNRENALHGLLFDESFEVTGEEYSETYAAVSMKYEYRGSDAGYPFHYDCTVTYRLEKENNLVVITEVVNRDSGSIPIQDGWHPYFTLGKKIDDLEFSFQSREMVEFDNDLIPTGELSEATEFNQAKKIGNKTFDNCFVLDHHKISGSSPLCILRDAEKNIQVEIRPDKSYPYLQIYTPDHRNSIALENISGAPDAFNNGMGYNVLSPGESVIFKTCYKVT